MSTYDWIYPKASHSFYLNIHYITLNIVIFILCPQMLVWIWAQGDTNRFRSNAFHIRSDSNQTFMARTPKTRTFSTNTYSHIPIPTYNILVHNISLWRFGWKRPRNPSGYFESNDMSSTKRTYNVHILYLGRWHAPDKKYNRKKHTQFTERDTKASAMTTHSFILNIVGCSICVWNQAPKSINPQSDPRAVAHHTYMGLMKIERGSTK